MQFLAELYAKHRNKPCIFVGDFNAFPLEIPSDSITKPKPNFPRDRRFGAFQTKYNLTCANLPHPTSFNSSGTNNVYDLVLSNKPDLVASVTPIDLSRLDINNMTPVINLAQTHGTNYHKPVLSQLTLTYPDPLKTMDITYDINYASPLRTYLPNVYENIKPIFAKYLPQVTSQLSHCSVRQQKLFLDTLFYFCQYATLKTNL